MKRPGFTLCVCPDAGLIKEYVASQLKQTPTGTAAPWERHTFWGDEELSTRFWEHLTLQGLFGVPRALVLRQAQNIPAAVWKRISAALASPNAQSWLFLCLEVAWEKGQPKIPTPIAKLGCVAFADKQGWVWRMPGMDERALRKYAQSNAKALGLRFAEGAVEAVCASTPPDATAIDRELLKLFLAAPDGLVTPAMTGSGGYIPESNIFAFIRYIQAGHFPALWRDIQRGMRDSDGLLFPLLGLLHREARLLWQVRAGEAVRLHPQEATAKQHMAARLDFAGIAKLIDLIMRAEWQLKAGERSQEQALEALVADLVRLFQS